MKDVLIIVNNLMKLSSAFAFPALRDVSTPGIGLVSGETGYGKTKAVAWLSNQVNGVFVKALATDTPTTMLNKILTKLGYSTKVNRISVLIESVIEHLELTKRPLFIG
ncbi:MAG TPA: ATP-binding protein [Leptolyngbyaceae cyanobacterium]